MSFTTQEPFKPIYDPTVLVDKWRKYQTYRRDAPARSFEEGEAFLYVGEERQLSVETTDRLHITPTKFVLPAAAVAERGIENVLKKLYRREAREYLQSRTDHYATEMDVNPGRLKLRNQRTRLASCSVQRTLSFNWRLIMVSPDVIDYVVVHELAHLRERNHTRRFWRIIRGQLPDYRERANWLEEYGIELIFTDEDI